MFQPGGPSALPERVHGKRPHPALPVSLKGWKRQRPMWSISKKSPMTGGDLVSQMITSTVSPIISLSRQQRLSSHHGGWTREPLPPLPLTRKEQDLLPRLVIPTQETEHAVGAHEDSPYGLMINITAELGVKPFSCPHCGKSFPQLRNLKDHQKYHHTGKAFTCSQCGKGFVFMCHLRVHMQCHTGEGPFSCSQCGKSFSLQSGLEKHWVLHTAERPYNCTDCGNRLYSRVDLKIHEQIHAAR
nr:gastrula zinc finger protein xLCGF3.1-like [Oncorhynchus nerka]